MLTTCTFNNVDGGHSWDFNTDNCPLSDFDVRPTQRVDTSRNRMQRHGTNPTLTSRGGMEIYLEGVFFRDTTDDFVYDRKAFVIALFGDPNVSIDLTNRKLGTLVLRWDGEGEDWQTDVTISAFSMPIKANYPTLAEFAVTFFSWDAWFTGSDSGTYYYWS